MNGERHNTEGSCRKRFFMQWWIKNDIEYHPREVMKSHFFNAIKKKQVNVYFCMLSILPEKGMKLLLSVQRTQMSLSWLWHFRTKSEKGFWISRKFLLLLVLMYARLSLAYIHILGVMQSVLLQVKGRQKP